MRDRSSETRRIPARLSATGRQKLVTEGKDRPRVLVAHNFYRNPGGEDRYVRSLPNLLNDRGFEAALLTFESRGMSGAKAAAHLITQRGELKQIESTMNRFQPDVVHLHNPYPGIGPAGARRLASRAPVIMTLHNYRLRCPNSFFYTNGELCERCASGSALNAARHRCLETRMQSLVYGIAFSLERLIGTIDESVSLFICPSPFMADKMKKLGVVADRMRYIPNFIEVKGERTQEVGDYVVFVGRLSPEKGAKVVVDSARETGFPTAIIGDGPERARLSADAPSNVKFCGWLSEKEVDHWMSRARVVIIPSLWYENLPYVFLEALAAGRPVFASNIGSLADLVQRYAVGAVFEHGSAPSLARILRSLWNERDQLLAWGETGARLARTEFSRDHHGDALREAYGAALAATQ